MKKMDKGNGNFSLSNSFEALNVENVISEEVEMDNKASTSEEECVLMDDDGKPLKKGCEDETESVDNEMESYLALKPSGVGYGTKSLLEQWREIYLPQQPNERKDEKEAPCFSTSCNTLSSSRIFTTTTLSYAFEKTTSGKFTIYYAHDENINNISRSLSSSHDFMDLNDDDDDDDHIKVPTAAAVGKRRLNIGGCSINSCSSSSSSNQAQQ
ncbi:hypothetical protein Tco_0323385 [Tanacetum coccineum]